MKGLKEDSAWGPMMMFGVTGPGPKADRKPIPSDHKKEKGINIKNFKKMKKISMYEDFINEETINEGFSDKVKNYAIEMARDSNIQRSARGLIDSIIGKPVDDAFSLLNRKLDAAVNVPLDDLDNNHRIRNREEAREVFQDYITNSSIEKTSNEEGEEVPISTKKFLRQKMKSIYTTIMSWLEENGEFEYNVNDLSINESIESLGYFYRSSEKNIKDLAKKIDSILNQEIKSDSIKKEILNLITDLVDGYSLEFADNKRPW